jgi:hypothetical protein
LPSVVEKTATEQYWLKISKGVKGPYTKKRAREVIGSAANTENIQMSSSREGPWRKINVASVKSRSNRSRNKTKRQIENDAIVEEYDYDYSDDYSDEYSDEYSETEQVSDSSEYRSFRKRNRSIKKSRRKSSNNSSGKSAPLWVNIVTYGLYLHGMIMAAYLLGNAVAMVRVLTVLCAEVFIPFQGGGVALREGDLAIAGMSLASTLVILIVPVIWFYQRDEKWLSFVIALIASLLVSQFVTIAVTRRPLSELLVWIPLVVPSGALAVASVLYCLSSRDWPTIYKSLGYAVFMLMATIFLHKAAPMFGLSLVLQDIPVYCRVSGPYLLIAVAVVAIEFGAPLLHWKSVAYGHMDRTTQNSIDRHCIEYLALCIVSMLSISTMMSDTPGWASALSFGVFSASLSSSVFLSLGQIELSLTYVAD